MRTVCTEFGTGVFCTVGCGLNIDSLGTAEVYRFIFACSPLHRVYSATTMAANVAEFGLATESYKADVMNVFFILGFSDLPNYHLRSQNEHQYFL